MDGDPSLDLQPCLGSQTNDEYHSSNGRQINLDVQALSDGVVELTSSSARVVLHRLAAVCREKKIARRVLAQRLGISVQELRQQAESENLSIGTLSRWAVVLGVPVTELIVEPEAEFAAKSLGPNQAARLMAVATRLRQRTRRRSVQRLAQTFVEQLAEILPALEQPPQGNPSRFRHAARAARPRALRPLPDDIFLRGREPGDR